MFLFFVLYQTIQILLLPVAAGYVAIRAIQKKPIFGNFFERMGLVPASKNKTIWIHAVSVGEVLSIQYLIEKLKQNSHETKIYLTVGTLTGKKIAQKQLKADCVSFLPYDFLFPMLIAFKRIKPNKIIIVEAEIWPNFLMLARFKKIPLYLINARVSKRSEKRYLALKFILTPLLNLFTHIYTQSEHDRNKFSQMGINIKKLSVWGNIKTFNVLQKRDFIAYPVIKQKNYITLLVGSIHPGELDIYLDLFKKLKSGPAIKLILAPRHFHWKQELVKKVHETGFSYAIWDELSRPTSSCDILLVCKLGELFTLYPQADLYFLGGTFVPIGGHNLLEPAVWGVPTIVGPHYFNSDSIVKELLNRNGIIVINKKRDDLYETVSKLLLDKNKLKSIGNNAQDWLEHDAQSVESKLRDFIAS